MGDRPGRTGCRCAGQPAIELPTDTLGDGGDLHGAWVGGCSSTRRPCGRLVPPYSSQHLSVLGLDLDTQARTGEAQPLKTVDELIGQRLGRESGDVDSRDGRIELSRDPELGWWTTARAGMLVQASGQPVCSGVARSGVDSRTARGEIGGETARGETGGRGAGGEIAGGGATAGGGVGVGGVAGGEAGSEAAVGDADLAAPQDAEDLVDGGQHL